MTGTDRNKGGRPSKLTPELQKQICDDVRQGVPITKAFMANGITEQTGYNWKRKNEGFAEALEQAEGDFERSALVCLYQDKDWKAKATLLKMRRPEYRDKGVEVNVKAEANASATAVPKERIEQIQRLRRVVTTGGLGNQ